MYNETEIAWKKENGHEFQLLGMYRGDMELLFLELFDILERTRYETWGRRKEPEECLGIIIYSYFDHKPSVIQLLEQIEKCRGQIILT